MPDPDSQLFDYLPHRPPMLLLNRMLAVGDNFSRAEVNIQLDSPFIIGDKGVPAWVGIEYMGQTAALIAGHQQRQQKLAKHMGFLLGTRRYKTTVHWFTIGSQLVVECNQAAVVGESLATFDCKITDKQHNAVLATARLSVFRKPVVA